VAYSLGVKDLAVMVAGIGERDAASDSSVISILGTDTEYHSQLATRGPGTAIHHPPLGKEARAKPTASYSHSALAADIPCNVRPGSWHFLHCCS
jgi:hypothetical protein